MKLTPTDRTLLRALQADCRISNQQLAHQTGMSTSACWRRLRFLESCGIITRYSALLDAEAAGLSFAAIVHITLTRHNEDAVLAFIEAMVKRPEVLECVATTGEADYHLRVLCADKEAYNRFLDEFLFTLPGIAHIKTNLILKEIKRETGLPL